MSGLHLGRAPLTYIICQIIVILFFGLFTEFKKGADPHGGPHAEEVAVELIKNHYACF